jgi:hypothetical protein
VAWTLIARSPGQVKREQFTELEDALAAVERHAHEFRQSAPQRPVDLRYKRIEPVQQVFARLELAGPQRFAPAVHAGVDVRGDGSEEAYLGRIRRRPIAQRPGESAASALRRVITESG